MSSAADRHLNSVHVVMAMVAAIKSGLVEALVTGPKAADALALELGWEVEPVARLADACAANGIVALGATGYGLTELGQELRLDHPSGYRFGLLSAVELYLPAMPAFVRPPLRSHTPFASAFGGPFYEVLGTRPELAELLMCDLSRAVPRVAEAPLVEDVVDASDGAVVDVGAGDGSLSRRLAERRPSREFVAVDSAWALAKAGPGPANVRLVAGDMFDVLPPGGLFVLTRVLFNWNDDAALRLLGVIRTAAGRHGRVLVIEPERPPAGAYTGSTPDLLALAIGGRARTDEELRALAEDADFRVVRSGPAGPFTATELVVA